MTDNHPDPGRGAALADGGPAFPIAEQHDDGSHYVTHSGMSLRDWFAGQALAGIARSPIDPGIVGRERHIVSVANFAYAVADAMLAARTKGPTHD